MRNWALNAPGTARDNIKHAWRTVTKMILNAKLNVTSKWPSVWHRAHVTRNVNLDALTVTRAFVVVNWTHRLRRLSAKMKPRPSMLSVWLPAKKVTLSVLLAVGEKMPNWSVSAHATSSVHWDVHVTATNAPWRRPLQQLQPLPPPLPNRRPVC